MKKRESRGKARLPARIAAALERLAPAPWRSVPPRRRLCLGAGAGRAARRSPMSPACRLSLLKGIEAARDTLLENTRRFADGLPANNALLWGARGMGKSSLVKAVHAEVNRRPQRRSATGADRNPPRGHRQPAAAAAPAARRQAPLPAVLRRSFLRQGRHQLQIAEGGAGRRHRRPARQRAVLRHLEPPPSDAARHDGQ